jgi:hypothetical protein
LQKPDVDVQSGPVEGDAVLGGLRTSEAGVLEEERECRIDFLAEHVLWLGFAAHPCMIAAASFQRKALWTPDGSAGSS